MSESDCDNRSQKGLQLLTAQEKRALKLVVKAQSNKEIAATLGIRKGDKDE